MKDKYRTRYRIKSSRAPWWDYAIAGSYFITICTRKRKHYFGTIVDGEMKLSAMGEWAHKFWNEIPVHFPNVELGAFQVMPDHIHGIIILVNNRKPDPGHDPQNDRIPAVETLHATSLPTLPNGNPPSPNGNPTLPNGNPPSPNGNPTLPNGNPPSPNGNPTLPNGNPPSPNGNPPSPNGNPTLPNGNPTLPNGIPPKSYGLPVPPLRFPTPRIRLPLSPIRIPSVNKNERMAAISPKSQTVSVILRSYKSAVSNKIHKTGMAFEWQPRFHDRIIRNDFEYVHIHCYIKNNPRNWKRFKSR